MRGECAIGLIGSSGCHGWAAMQGLSFTLSFGYCTIENHYINRIDGLVLHIRQPIPFFGGFVVELHRASFQVDAISLPAYCPSRYSQF